MGHPLDKYEESNQQCNVGIIIKPLLDFKQSFKYHNQKYKIKIQKDPI